jgi:radical SAM superfamily enzyme YgiQ (UPF0313 family)
MKVFFLNIPYHERFSRESRSPGVAPSGTLYYPIYLALAAGLVRSRGHVIDFLDAPAERMPLDRVKLRVQRFRPDLIVASTVTASVLHDVRVMEQLGLETGALTMLAGTHATARPVETLKLSPRLDLIAVGEYDFTVLDVADHFHAAKSRAELSAVPGLAYRNGHEVLVTPARPLQEDLDRIPWASLIYRDFLKIENYSYGAQLHPEVTIVGGRGCPFQCSFCVFPQTITGHRYRARSVKDVVDEMEFIRLTWPQCREIMFEDDTLTVDKERLRALSEEILRRKLDIAWSGNARADFDDAALLKLMKRAGCRLFCVGFESADQGVLNRMRKGGATVAMQERFVAACREAGILIHACFLFGGPGETQESMRRTLEFAKRIRPDTAQFFPLMAYPGTRAYDEARGAGVAGETEPWLSDQGYYRAHGDPHGLQPSAVERFCDRALREFYLRPSYFAEKAAQFIKEPRERSRIFYGARFFLKKLAAMGRRQA